MVDVVLLAPASRSIKPVELRIPSGSPDDEGARPLAVSVDFEPGTHFAIAGHEGIVLMLVRQMPFAPDGSTLEERQ